MTRLSAADWPTFAAQPKAAAPPDGLPDATKQVRIVRDGRVYAPGDYGYAEAWRKDAEEADAIAAKLMRHGWRVERG